MSCSICYEKYNDTNYPSIVIDGNRGKSCGHVFCNQCIIKIPKFGNIMKCPTCRMSCYNPIITKIYIQIEKPKPRPRVVTTLEECIEQLNKDIIANSKEIVKQDMEIQKRMEIKETYKREIAITKESLSRCKENFEREKKYIEKGEGILFEREFKRRRKEIDSYFERIKGVETEKHEILKTTLENELKQKIKEIETSYKDFESNIKAEYQKIATQLIEINEEFYNFKIFTKSSKQAFVRYYPNIIKELFDAVNIIKSLKDIFSPKQRADITKCMKTLKTLDISIFCEYTKKEVIDPSIASIDDIYQFEKEIKKELQRGVKLKIPDFRIN